MFPGRTIPGRGWAYGRFRFGCEATPGGIPDADSPGPIPGGKIGCTLGGILLALRPGGMNSNGGGLGVDTDPALASSGGKIVTLASRSPRLPSPESTSIFETSGSFGNALLAVV